MSTWFFEYPTRTELLILEHASFRKIIGVPETAWMKYDKKLIEKMILEGLFYFDCKPRYKRLHITSKGLAKYRRFKKVLERMG